MHTINQSLAATILRLMRSRSWPISFCGAGATDFASIDARILLGNAHGQVDLPLDAKGFQRLEVVAVHAVASSRRVCGWDEFPERGGLQCSIPVWKLNQRSS